MATVPSSSAKPRTDIGILVRQLRQVLGLTQAQFAAKLGVALPTINRWENNRSQPLPLALIQLKLMLTDLQNSPNKLDQVCAQTFLEEYFNQD